MVCDQPVTRWRHGALCANCAGGLKPLAPPFCLRCGIPQPSRGEVSGRDSAGCAACLDDRLRVDLARAALVYDDPLRTAIHHFKYNDRVSLARPFGRAMAACLSSPPYTATHVVPVPLSRRRDRQRGYNQAYLLARQLDLEVDAKLVRRSRDTPSQTGLTRRQRALNVRNAFECRKSVSGSWLIVDDVMTTGATINEIARTLRRAGAARVEALTLTRVPDGAL